ncbi:hypothetical protein T4D_14589 [Trichinella pseudospiralis]|uniref:Uncharacterized protein n=1 Tax=Trichinella pseudospiralis TaxID=6337 RepID=A0A0V1FVG7_TRIPS|nr:hypothetical protein T4D_14589 [Trichinella pseudospiralis]
MKIAVNESGSVLLLAKRINCSTNHDCIQAYKVEKNVNFQKWEISNLFKIQPYKHRQVHPNGMLNFEFDRVTNFANIIQFSLYLNK